ncbi:MAG TPA: CarD family transcriptional regulator, partial [Thermoleophilia bacterium]|nr:CarD family transcriptional regulator [Thermoleophilia bacterium]
MGASPVWLTCAERSPPPSATRPVRPPGPRTTSGGYELYSVGDKVVYPHHGAGKIMKIEQKEVLGQQRDYLTIQILHNDMTV